MRDKIHISSDYNRGNISGVNNGISKNHTCISSNVHLQQYNIHSAARISNYFSWVKFIVTIAAGAVAFIVSAIFAAEIRGAFLVLAILSLICFFTAIISGLLSFLGNVVFEETKAVNEYQLYWTNDDNTLFRVTVKPWYSKCGNLAFYSLTSGVVIIVGSIIVYCVDLLLKVTLSQYILFFLGLILSIFIVKVIHSKTKDYLFKADNEDMRIMKIEKRERK